MINFVDGSFAALGTILEVTTKFRDKFKFFTTYNLWIRSLHPWQQDFKTRSLCFIFVRFFLMEDQLEIPSFLK